jgi:hypothetical protein
MPIVHYRPRRADVNRDPQSQIFRPHLHRTKPRRLLRQTHGRDDSGGPAGKFLVHLPMPLRQLLLPPTYRSRKRISRLWAVSWI